MNSRTLRLHQVIVPEHIHRMTISEDAIRDLARSIEQNGLINPITVIDNGDDTYTLRAGHSRLLAHQYLNRSTIDATIRTGSVRDTAGITFAENLHRTQLSPMEEAYAIQHEHQHNLVPIDTIARVLNRTEQWVLLRLALTVMPPTLRELVHTDQLPIGSALALAAVSDDPHREYLTRYAINAGAAVTVIREWVRQWQLSQELGTGAAAPRPAMPEPGQQVVVNMPCYVCGDPHPYQDLRITRICGGCILALNQHDAPPPHHQVDATSTN